MPGADQVVTPAIDQDFAGNREWEMAGSAPVGRSASSAASKTAGAQSSSSWDADGADWAAGSAPVQTGNDGWNAETKKEGEVQW